MLPWSCRDQLIGCWSYFLLLRCTLSEVMWIVFDRHSVADRCLDAARPKACSLRSDLFRSAFGLLVTVASIHTTEVQKCAATRPAARRQPTRRQTASLGETR
jgi:hypothetical protein